MTTLPTDKRTQKDEALDALRRCYPKGSTVYTILRKVSRSGMQRHISVLALQADLVKGEYTAIDLHPNWSASIVTGYRSVPRGLGYDGLVLNGAGTDMGFAIAYALSYALHGDGYALKHRWL